MSDKKIKIKQTWIGLNDATRDAIRDQGIEDMQSLTEINQEDIKDLVNNVMKYQAPLEAAGMVSICSQPVKGSRQQGTGLTRGAGKGYRSVQPNCKTQS
jgi:hypothetical protein